MIAGNGFTNALLNTTVAFTLTVINSNQYSINGNTVATSGGLFDGPQVSVTQSPIPLPNNALKQQQVALQSMLVNQVMVKQQEI